MCAGILAETSFGLGLRDPAKPATDAPVDAVAFGAVAVGNPFLEGTPASGLLRGVSGARYPFDGNDTDNGGRDFSTLIPSPKAPNSAPHNSLKSVASSANDKRAADSNERPDGALEKSTGYFELPRSAATAISSTSSRPAITPAIVRDAGTVG